MRYLLPVMLAAALFAPRVGAAAVVTVSAAISLKAPLAEAARVYSRESGQAVELNFGATGRLLAQIRDGAPVDAFIAASSDQMEQAVTQRLVDPATRTVIAGNRLVLIVPVEASIEIGSFNGLSEPAIRRLAIGEPRIVPAGFYARQILRSLRLEPAMAGRMVHAASVRQVLDYVERGEVDAGIVYATDVTEARGRVRVVEVADSHWHEPIWYIAATVARSPRAEGARGFIRFLASAPGQKILADQGFTAAEGRDDGAATSRPSGQPVGDR